MTKPQGAPPASGAKPQHAATEKCPECGELFSKVGMYGHRAMRHGVKAPPGETRKAKRAAAAHKAAETGTGAHVGPPAAGGSLAPVEPWYEWGFGK